MRYKEFFCEAMIHPHIQKILTKKGYRFLDHGQDQDVYLAPDGTILKIFGWDMMQGREGFSLGQKAFITFANFCRANNNNSFLPDFSDWDTFEHNNKTYLQIKCERLFPIKGEWESFGKEVQYFAENIVHWGADRGLQQYMNLLTGMERDYPEAPSLDAPNLLILTLGQDGLKQFARTIDQIKKIGRSKGYDIDLHSNNFMFGSDGHLVINDPFWGGGTRRLGR